MQREKKKKKEDVVNLEKVRRRIIRDIE